MASQAVVVRYESGEEYQVASVEKAFEVHPTARIVRWGDGRPYYPPVEALATPDTEAEPVLHDEVSASDLWAHTVKELRDLAAALEIAIPGNAKKGEIIAILETSE